MCSACREVDERDSSWFFKVTELDNLVGLRSLKPPKGHEKAPSKGHFDGRM